MSRLRERPYFGLALRVRERPQFCRNTTRDRGGLAARLEAREVRTVAPRNRSAQTNTRLQRRVMDDVDRALVVGCALPEPGEVPEITARGKQRRYARHLRDLVGVLQPFERLDHQDEHDVVVDGVAVSSRTVAPHAGVERVPAADTATAERPAGSSV